MAGFGAAFKRAVRERYPARIELHPFGGVLPRPTNRITVVHIAQIAMAFR